MCKTEIIATYPIEEVTDEIMTEEHEIFLEFDNELILRRCHGRGYELIDKNGFPSRATHKFNLSDMKQHVDSIKRRSNN